MIFKALMVFFFLDLNLKILRDDSACPGACQVIQWFVSHKSACHPIVVLLQRLSFVLTYLKFLSHVTSFHQG